MKKGIVFFVFLLMFSFLASKAYAQTASASSALSASQPQYDFPYPGILPDNPLYPLKTFRDRMISILISDPLKKSQFDLLNSDKRVIAGLDMFDRGKNDLGVTTISKSNNYFEEAIGQLAQAKKLKEDTSGILQQMKKGLIMRDYLFTNKLKNLSGSSKNGLTQEEKRVDRYEKTVNGMLPKQS